MQRVVVVWLALFTSTLVVATSATLSANPTLRNGTIGIMFMAAVVVTWGEYRGRLRKKP